MRVKYGRICLICFKVCDLAILKARHHTCNKKCEKELLTLCKWERDMFGDSELERMSKNY